MNEDNIIFYSGFIIGISISIISINVFKYLKNI